MSSFSIVENFDVIKEALLGLLPGSIPLATNTLDLKRMKKAFNHGIVIAVAFAAHAADQAMFF